MIRTNQTPDGQPKIGVYICHCGMNIAGQVGVEEVTAFASSLPNVVVARHYKFMCSDPGQELIQADIAERGVNRVVVASCSPLLHEATFRQACAAAGLNPFCFQMANIREQVSWVTADKDHATSKAKALVAAAARRVALHQPLERRRVAVRRETLVVGAGIAGIEAALRIADSGKKVYLVERDSSIGGHMAKFDKTFPTLDCAACILTPKMVRVARHPNVELVTLAEVDEVSGYVGNFTVKLRRRARYVTGACTGCGQCEEVCPCVQPNQFEMGRSQRKAIYRNFPQAVPNWFVIDYGACSGCRLCEDVCEAGAIDHEQEDEVEEIQVGTIVLATGFKTFDPRILPQYGYGRYENVYTSLEVERMVNASGPTGGQVLLADGSEPKSVAIIHCVGSRDKKTNPWCSKVCCMYSLKLAHLVKQRTGAEVYNFYIDMRTPGKGYEEFYDRLLEEGVQFVRGRVADITDWPMTEAEEGKLVVRAEDSLIGVTRRIPVDMVILSVGLEPQLDAHQMRKKFNISCSSEGWFLERHPKLAPVATFTDGVWIAGACQGPKDIPETVAQAGAAASEAIALMDKGHVEIEPNTVEIDEEKCSGCKTCLGMCPYHAISRDDQKGVAVVNQAMCKGCGTCAAACPSGAIRQHLFTDEEIYQEIEGVLSYV
ncbi:MAG TPA: CoB--CoM heterodisulfide reductase iron-sulfur subunit A family protein [Planctomycetes bacterium]|nr:CoB--CoM heterodisulfide reductase iron-sulfur subunit A family protein [Planctomycetota bacterium]